MGYTHNLLILLQNNKMENIGAATSLIFSEVKHTPNNIVSGTFSKVIFSKDKMKKACGVEVPTNMNTQHYPFHISLVDPKTNNVLKHIKNVWVESIGDLFTDYNDSEWVIIQDMNWKAETVE